MRSRILFFGLCIFFLFLIIGSCPRAGSWLVKKDEPVTADAIVILMGSIPDRVLHAADLYKEKMSAEIMMVEESMGAYRKLEERGVRLISNSNQARNALVALGIPAENITIIPGDATSTQMEAEIIREYLQARPDLDTILLVSSASHTRRASMIFKTAFKTLENPVTILCSPSPYTNFNAEKWWRDREDVQKVLGEYVKIASFLIFEKRKLREEALAK
ncbi:MAG: YdcF family protein [Bacteroidales bacterium]|nr:YdcF family protein [Bacteroidales bacterium]